MADYTILSIDDDESARVLFEIMLKRSGFNVLQAVDGDEALAIVDSTIPDLIMTDIQLPGINGIELVAEFRKREELDQTAIIVLSAFQSESMIDDAKSAGADEFYKKPLKMDALSQRLIEIINRRRNLDNA
ncbi:MAG: response regulator [Chloroflexota bacterium]